MNKSKDAEDRDTLAVVPADPDGELPQGGTFVLPGQPKNESSDEGAASRADETSGE